MKILALVAFTFMLVNVLGILNRPPAVYASTDCSYDGGSGGGPHYYAGVVNTDTPAYGNKATINAEDWGYNAGYEGASLTWTDLAFSDGDWVQGGLIIGVDYTGTYSTSRVMFMEYNVGGSDYVSMLTGDAIPDNDNDVAGEFGVTQNGDGTYTFEIWVYSSTWGTYSEDPNMGYDYGGTAELATENIYQSEYQGTEYYYSGTCNAVGDNDQSGASVCLAFDCPPSWTSWPDYLDTYYNGNYSIYTDSSSHFYETGE